LDPTLLVGFALAGVILLATILVAQSGRRRRGYGAGDPDGPGWEADTASSNGGGGGDGGGGD